MKKDWNSPKIIIGSPATGTYYFDRPAIIEEIWEELAKGNYILIAAPRRVGKTSIMKHMVENPRPYFKPIFENIQSIKSEDEFYKTIYKLILDRLGSVDKAKKWLGKYLKSKSITEVDIKGSFKIEHTKINFLNELNNLIPELADHDETIVLLIDELPEVLHQLYANEKTDEAVSILKNLRRWRQDDQFKYLKFVLSGSIGIHYVVQNIEGRNADLNDLKNVRYEAMDLSETQQYIKWATNQATVRYSTELIEYLFNKISYSVPFFLNLILDEIDKRARRKRNPNIFSEDIDKAFDHIIKNNDFFRDWKLRLSGYLPEADYKFCNEVLAHIAHEEKITIQVIYDKARKHKREDNYMELISDLEKDGYIMQTDKCYQFVSPFLKFFWKNDNPVYNG